jgi:hypothetical protein
MNFITNLPLCKERENIQIYDNVLVMIDRYSKLVKYIAMKKDLITEGLVTLII